MRRVFISGIILKVLFSGVFFFLDFDLGSSGSVTPSKITRTEPALFIPERINNELSDIECFGELETGISSLLRKFDMKGATVAVSKNGRLVYAKGIGYADVEAQEVVEPGHMFRVASVSKLITAITIMKMRERGLLDLDDMVFGPDGILNDSIYLDYIDRRVERITIGNLLEHSSGWNRRYGDHMFMNHTVAREMKVDGQVSISDVIRFALSKRLHFNPGSGNSYSNLGYAILGEVISSVSGMPYEAYVQQTILLPLGIRDMRIGKNLDTDRFDNEVKYYEQYNALPVNSIYNIQEKVPEAYGGNDIEMLGAAGGWIASAAEILKLVNAVDSQSGSLPILTEESIDLMVNGHLQGNRLIGWTGSDRQGNYWRTGTFAGTSAIVMRQNNGLTWSVFFNSSTYRGTTLANDIRRVVQPALSKIQEWPVHDLFYYAETPPLTLILPLPPSPIQN